VSTVPAWIRDRNTARYQQPGDPHEREADRITRAVAHSSSRPQPPAESQRAAPAAGTKMKLPLKMCRDCGTPWDDPGEAEDLFNEDYQRKLERYYELMEEYAKTGKRPLDLLLDMQMPK
jgi:hypothetical protein